MKAIITTSANPFHYGHLNLYKEAKKIFGIDNISIAIGKNASKDINFNRIIYHLTPYKVKYEIAEGITLSDYCERKNVDYIIRGIRNAVDAEYELKLDFLNKEINNKIQTMFFPTKHIFSNISSSSINELLKYNKYDVVKKYMNEDAMFRFINKSPTFIIFFGKSCIGKTYYLENILYKNKNIIKVDDFFWDVFKKCYGENLSKIIKDESRKLIYNNENLSDLINKYSTDKFWQVFFDYIKTKFSKYRVENLDLEIDGDVYLLDFAHIGAYWDTIPSHLKGKLYLIEMQNSEINRNIYINKKNFSEKISYLDNNYKKPSYYDMVINIDENE